MKEFKAGDVVEFVGEPRKTRIPGLSIVDMKVNGKPQQTTTVHDFNAYWNYMHSIKH